MKVSEILAKLKEDGWILVVTRGATASSYIQTSQVG